MNKLRGLTILINTFLPLILLLIFIMVIFLVKPDITKAWSDIHDVLDSIIEKTETTVLLVKNIQQKTAAELEESALKFNQLKNDIDNLYTTMKEPIDEIAKLKISYANGIALTDNYVKVLGVNINVPKPSLTKNNYKFGKIISTPFTNIMDAIDKLRSPFSDLQQAMSELEKLKAIQLSMAQYQIELGELAKNTKALFATLAQALSYFMYLVIALLLWFGWTWLLVAQERTSKAIKLLRSEVYVGIN